MVSIAAAGTAGPSATGGNSSGKYRSAQASVGNKGKGARGSNAAAGSSGYVQSRYS